MKVKKLLCLALCLVMVFTLLPAGVLAGDGPNYNVGSQSIGLDNDAYGDGWSWDCSGQKLTLNNAYIVGSENNDGAISLPDNSTIEFDGENAVRGCDSTAGLICGISCPGSLTITGSGSITAVGGTANAGNSYGIACGGSLTITGSGSINAVGGTANAGNSYGVFCSRFTISGTDTKVVAVGGKNNGDGTNSYGIGANTTIYTSGLLVAKGGTIATKSSVPTDPFLLYNSDNCVVCGNEVIYHVHEGNVTGSNHYDDHITWAGDNLAINNTIIIGADSTKTANALSFSNSGTLTCTGFNVVLAGSVAAGDSNAVSSGDNDLTVSGSGRLVAIGGEAGGGNSNGIVGNRITLNCSVTAISGYGGGSYGICASAINLGGTGTAVGGTQAMNIRPSTTNVVCTGAYASKAMAWVMAQETPTVRIKGSALNAATPYYTKSGSTSVDNNCNWNAWFEATNSTLHLSGLSVNISEPQAIQVTGVSTLYIELEGDNIVTTTNSDDTSSGISAGSTELVIYGSGTLTVTAVNGVGISAQSIKLQYPATLTVKGRVKATDKTLTCTVGAYDAKGGDNVDVLPAADYNFNDTDAATTYKHITFTPKAAPAFPVWVNGTQVSAENMGNVLGDSQVSYAYAHGSTPATLTLNWAYIASYKTFGSLSAGIYAGDEPLCILLKGTNFIVIDPDSSSNDFCGVYSKKALTIKADAGASLDVYVSRGSSTYSGNPYAIKADGGITLDSSCQITEPDGAKISTNGKYISDSNNTALDYATITGNVITIQRSGGETFDVHVELTDSIENIKAKIQEHWGYSPDRQRLSYDGTPLAEGKTLHDYNITYGETIDLAVTTNTYANNLPATCTLTFNTNGGSAVAAVNKTVGETVDLTGCVPTREGYTFTGWYSDAALTKPVTSVTLSGSATVYAGWQASEPEEAPWENSFADVSKTDWFYSDVEYAVSRGLFKGITDTTFEPGAPMSRAMLVTVLYRLAGEPTIMFVRTPDKVFSDVPDGIWYEKAVQWAQLSGIVEGYGGKFAPDGDVTREQLAAILYRYAQHMGYDVSVGEDTNILSYTDAFDISEYAIPAMQWVCGAGIMEGSGESLMPQGNAQRCQVAAMLHRFCENVK